MMRDWVLLTRDPERVADIVGPLARAGIEVVALPVLVSVDHDDHAAWARVVGRLSELELTVVTSPRAPAPWVEQARRRGLAAAVRRLPVAAVGEASARAAAASGFSVALVGGGGGADLGRAILGAPSRPALVVHPCGREHRAELGEVLRGAGVDVLEVPVYAVEPVPPAALPALPPDPPRAVVLSSPRAASAYLAACGERYGAVPHLAFGPTTATAARDLGIPVRALPRPTPECLVEELCQIS